MKVIVVQCFFNTESFVVFSVSEGEVNWMVRHGVLKGGENGMSTNYVVRLRGIPFSATTKDIKEFFDGMRQSFYTLVLLLIAPMGISCQVGISVGLGLAACLQLCYLAGLKWKIMY